MSRNKISSGKFSVSSDSNHLQKRLSSLNDSITNKIVPADLEVEDINNAGQIVGSATIRGA